MQIIQAPTKLSQDFIKINQGDETTHYRWFTYIYKMIYDNMIVLMNTLTRCIVMLTEEEYSNYIDNDILKRLLFVVPFNYPDYDIYRYILTLRKPSYSLDIYNTLHSYVILSTMKCNARCKYCYENTMKRFDISQETLQNICKLIKENYEANQMKVQIKMFGGEPFLNYEVFDKIFKFMQENNIEYQSDFISNGYYIDQNLCNWLNTTAQCQFGQITIDGTEHEYNRIKNYKDDDCKSPYRQVLRNIERLLKSNEKFVMMIRINFDLDNYEDTLKVAKQLKRKFYKYKNCGIYAHHIFNEYSIDDSMKIIEIYKKFDEILEVPNRNQLKYANSDITNCVCMVESIHNILIYPNGDIYKCEAIPCGMAIGNLNHLILNHENIDIDKFNKYLDYNIVDECHKCNIKPECLRLKVCHNNSKPGTCDLIQKYIIEKKLNEKITNTIKMVLDNCES